MLIFTADDLTGAIEFHTSRNPTVRYNGRVYSSMSGHVLQDTGVQTQYELTPINLADPDLGIHLVQNQARIHNVIVTNQGIGIRFDPNANVSILGNQNVRSAYLFLLGPPPVNGSSELQSVRLSTSRTTE